MRSLALKLSLAFLLVTLTGVVLVAVVVGLLTRREFDRFVLDRYQADLVTRVSEYYETYGSWTGIEGALTWRRGSGGRGGPVDALLYDADRQVVAGGMRMSNVAFAEENAIPVSVGNEVVGYVLFEAMPRARDVRQTAEAAFLSRVNRAIAISAAGAGALALLLGLALAGSISRPVQELTEGTKALAAGALGHQVPVRTRDEIGALAQSFNRMSADLASANQLRKQMTADIAHDLRTPLSIILGYSEALQDGKLPATPETLGAMHLQAQHLNRLIDDLRTLSLADAGQLSLQRRLTGTRELLEHTALAYWPQAEAAGIALAVEGDGAPVSVDPDRLVQVLGNLVGNALRYTPRDGRIALATARNDQEALLTVTDSGPGIPPDDLPYVFDRFYRGDKARTTTGTGDGAGLGLAIARSLVEAHGGRLMAENVPQGGARFTIALAVAG